MPWPEHPELCWDELNRNKMEDFLKFTIDNLLLLENQYLCSEGDNFWCDDYEQIEWMKYLYEGKDRYYAYPPPSRGMNNPLFSKDRVKAYCKELMAFHGKIHKIEEELKTLFIVNAKRGLDIFLSNMGKDWKKTVIFNDNKNYDSLVQRQFSHLSVVIIPDENIDLKEFGPVLKIKNTGEYDEGIKREWNILNEV